MTYDSYLFGRIDPDEARCFFNPTSMSALHLVEACGDDISEAKEIASSNIQFEREPKKWVAIYQVLNGEVGRA
jgi:hypothetical protein